MAETEKGQKRLRWVAYGISLAISVVIAVLATFTVSAVTGLSYNSSNVVVLVLILVLGPMHLVSKYGHPYSVKTHENRAFTIISGTKYDAVRYRLVSFVPHISTKNTAVFHVTLRFEEMGLEHGRTVECPVSLNWRRYTTLTRICCRAESGGSGEPVTYELVDLLFKEGTDQPSGVASRATSSRVMFA